MKIIIRFRLAMSRIKHFDTFEEQTIKNRATRKVCQCSALRLAQYHNV